MLECEMAAEAMEEWVMEAVYGGGDDSSTGGELTELIPMEPAFRDEGALEPTDTQTCN